MAWMQSQKGLIKVEGSIRVVKKATSIKVENVS